MSRVDQQMIDALLDANKAPAVWYPTKNHPQPQEWHKMPRLRLKPVM
jgi:hypothetical protein